MKKMESTLTNMIVVLVGVAQRVRRLRRRLWLWLRAYVP